MMKHDVQGKPALNAASIADMGRPMQSAREGGGIKKTPDMLRIGRNIKALRERLELTTREFAAGVPGLRTSNLSEIERGIRRLTMPMLEGICRKYRVTADTILIGDPGADKGGTLRQSVRMVPVLPWG